MSNEGLRKQRHIAGTIVITGRFDECLNARDPERNTFRCVRGTSSARRSELTPCGFSTKWVRLKREGIESDVEFLPRPCRRGLSEVAPWPRPKPGLAGPHLCLKILQLS
jgi:hypothetical protein